jgi:hypothetical protein
MEKGSDMSLRRVIIFVVVTAQILAIVWITRFLFRQSRVELKNGLTSHKASSPLVLRNPLIKPTITKIMNDNVRVESEPEEIFHYDYPRPEKLSTFADSKLADAFDFYMSRIGEYKDTYAFERSGFDTSDNAELAEKTILSMNYKNPSAEQIQAQLLAIDFLSFSHLPDATARIEQVTEELIRRASEEKNKLTQSLVIQDIDQLLEGHHNVNHLALLYGKMDDPRLKSSIALAIENHLDQTLQDAVLKNAFLTAYHIQPLQGLTIDQAMVERIIQYEKAHL